MDRLIVKLLTAVSIVVFTGTNGFAQMGHVMQGAGAVNRSMEGAATGNPVDSCGAMYWNVAGMSRLKRSMMCISSEYFTNDLSMYSKVGPFSDTDDSDFPASIIPSMSYVQSDKESDWSFGICFQGVSGFGVRYDESTTNPILMSQASGGFGGINSEFSLLNSSVGASYEVTEDWAFGVAPILGIAWLEVDPFPGTSPTMVGYPNTERTDTFGFGCQFATIYSINEDWSIGASHKTTQNFAPFEFRSTKGDFTFDMDFPSVTSLGVGFTGWKGLVLNLDTRYVDYEHTDGFREPAEFDSTGAVKGFGWDSIWQFAIGSAYKVSNNVTFRCGYSHNDSPINSENVFFNVHAPAVITDHASIGLTYEFQQNAFVTLGWSHGFKNSVSGPMYNMAGPVPGSEVEVEMSTDSALLSFGYKF